MSVQSEERLAVLLAQGMTPREDLRPLVESSRFALTWDDVAIRERQGRPYAPRFAVVPSTLAAEDIRPGMRMVGGEWLYSARWL